jgi:DNA-binding response OmpR family regulator
MSVLELAKQLAASPRILIAEGDLNVVVMLTRAISIYDCEIDPASTVAESVKLIEARKYDLVFVDITLSDGSGVSVIKSVKVKMPTTPILVMATSEDAVQIKEVLLLGIVTVMLKPFKLDELRNVLTMFKVRSLPGSNVSISTITNVSQGRVTSG